MLISFFLRFNVPRHIVDSSLDCAYEVDPFAIMLEKGYKYAYWLYFYDNNLKTGQTLWRAVGDYINWKKITPKSGFSNLAAHFPSPVQGEFHRVSFLLLLSFSPLQQPTAHISPTTQCHYWNNAEIMDLSFFRSQEYQQFFTFLDHSGGFFEYRWGDALVRTMGVNLLLEESQIHHFQDLAYAHGHVRNTVADCDDYNIGDVPCPEGICYNCGYVESRYRGIASEDIVRMILVIVIVDVILLGFAGCGYCCCQKCRPARRKLHE